MKIISIDINRGWDREKPLKGTIKFEDEDKNEMSVRISEETASKIIGLIADDIVRAGQAVAHSMTREALERSSRPAIEHTE